jgi:heme/copper-type cytochrome/quinol oxidase subunit 4
VSENKAKAYRRGSITFLILLLLTAVEFYVGVTIGSSIALLMILALLKAALIVYIFMHVYRLWREESH